MAKGDILRAILKMKHSPAGKKYLKKKKIMSRYVGSPGTKGKLKQMKLSTEDEATLLGK